jgi:hypothetical protein
MTEKIKEYADWVYTMIKNPINKRKAWVKDIFINLNKGTAGKKNNPKELKNLAELLCDKAKFDLVGFSANLHYVKHDLRKGDEEADLNCVFVHPWASPKLLYKHKDLPVIMIIGEDLRLDESVLDDNSKNVTHSIRGFTG